MEFQFELYFGVQERELMASFVILKISVLSLNSFFSQNGDGELEFTS